MLNQFNNHGMGTYDDGTYTLYSPANALDSGTATYNLASTETFTYSADTSKTNETWKFGDGAPS